MGGPDDLTPRNLAWGLCCNTIPTDVHDMSSVTGTTSNAFSYEGDYAVGARGRVTWTATYRKEGAFFGMRNGQLEQMQDVSASDVDTAVKTAIELRWAGM